MAGDIFLSANHKDSDRIANLIKILRASGVEVWWAEEENAISESIYVKVDHMLNTCRLVLVVWSKNAVDSVWVQAEAGYALQHKKILQVKIDDVELMAPFAALDSVDLFALHSEQEIQAKISQIFDNLGVQQEQVTPIASQIPHPPIKTVGFSNILVTKITIRNGTARAVASLQRKQAW